jgi:hypothetical protein
MRRWIDPANHTTARVGRAAEIAVFDHMIQTFKLT